MVKDAAVATERYNRLVSVVKLVGYKSFSIFCDLAGVSYNGARQMKLGRVINFNPKIIAYLEKHHPQVNINYLRTGKGIPMIDENAAKPVQVIKQKAVEDIETIPFYDISATAGKLTLTLEDAKTYASDHIHSNALKGAQVAISVHGDSMSDAFPGGSIIALRQVEDIEVIPYGEAYVIETADHRLLKYIRRGSTPSTVLLVSHNESFEPFEIERRKIKKLWKVLGMIRRIQS